MPSPTVCRMHRRRPLRAVLALATVGWVALGVSSASADQVDQVPVTQGETVTLWAGTSGAVVKLLANDSDPDGEKLQVCRFGEAQPDWRLDVEPEDGERNGRVEVSLDPSATGVYTYDYQVCDRSYLVPATLTLDVQPVGVTTVEKVPRRPRLLRVTNPDQHRVFFLWGPPSADDFLGIVRIASGGSQLVRAGTSRVDWAAGFAEGEVGVYTGYGTVRGLKPSGNPRPASAVGRVRVPSALADALADPLADALDNTRADGRAALPRRSNAATGARRTGDGIDPTTVAPPVTQFDEVSWWAGAQARVHVLANDHDPQGQHLDVCRIDSSGRAVSAFTQLSNTGFQVSTDQDSNGTFTITYYACNVARLAPGTVTVHLRRARPVGVTAHGGDLRIANRNGDSVRVRIDDPEIAGAQRTVRVAAHSVRHVQVEWTYLRWYAQIGHPRGFAGYGHLHLNLHP
ncbi:hypothetical protein ACVW2K_004086 [Nocardioides sp. HB32]